MPKYIQYLIKLYDTNLIFNSLIFIFFIFFIGLICFFFLYTYLYLEKTIYSLILFLINYSIFVFYIFCFYKLFKGFENPIYFCELSIYFYYRYLFYSFICLLIILLYLISYKYDKIFKILSYLSYPHLTEEMRIIFKACFNDFLGTLSVKIIDKMIFSPRFKFVYFFFKFLLLVFIKFILLFFFFKFIFLGGDLRHLLYCLPLSFLGWLFSFFFYAVFWMIESNYNYMQECLTVTMDSNKNITFNDSSQFIAVLPSDLLFQLTPFGYSEGFTNHSYPRLVNQWLALSSVKVSYMKYSKITKRLQKILLLSYILCWFYISVIFFLKNNTPPNIVMLTGFWNNIGLTFIKRGFHTTAPTFKDARWLHESTMNFVSSKTGSRYSAGHLVYGDLLPDGSFKALGMLTSKPKTPKPDITPIKLPTETRINGTPGDQYYIPFLEPLYLPKGSFKVFPIKNSEQYLAQFEKELFPDDV